MNEIELIQTMLDSDPANPYLHYLLAWTLYYNNDRQKATTEMNLAREQASELFLQLIEQTEPLMTKETAKIQKSQNTFSKTPSLQVLDGGIQTIESKEKKEGPYFKDIAGLDEIKRSLEMRLSSPLLHSSVYHRFGRKSASGFILYGPSGCGKSMLVQAAANEFDLPLTLINTGNVIDPFYGQSARNLHNMFEEAREENPLSIIAIEELDVFAYHRGKSSPELRNIVDQLIQELDINAQSNNQIMVIGMTNMPWDIDPAFRSHGRLNKSFFVAPPDKKARALIFEQALQGKPHAEMNYAELAEKTSLFTAADIHGLVDQAVDQVIDDIFKSNDQNRNVEQKDLLKVIDPGHSSAIDWLRNMANYVSFANQSGVFDEVAHYLEENTDYLKHEA